MNSSQYNFSNILATNQESVLPTPFNSRLKIAHVILFSIVFTMQKEKKNQLQYVHVAEQ